jgi:hypothetical protein
MFKEKYTSSAICQCPLGISPTCRVNLLLKAEIQGDIELASLLGTYLNLSVVIPRPFTMNPSSSWSNKLKGIAIATKGVPDKVSGAHCIHKLPTKPGIQTFFRRYCSVTSKKHHDATVKSHPCYISLSPFPPRSSFLYKDC